MSQENNKNESLINETRNISLTSISDKDYIKQRIKNHFYGSTFNKTTLDYFVTMLYEDNTIKNKKLIHKVIDKYLRFSKSRDAYYFDMKQINLKLHNHDR